MLAHKTRYHAGPPPSVPTVDRQALGALIERRASDLAPCLDSNPTIMIEESGTALLVTRADNPDLSLLLHARPGEIEFGVAEEPRFPLLSVVVSLGTNGGPRYAGLTIDIGNPEEVSRYRLLISQPSVDLVVLDPASRLAAAHRIELPLWSRAQAHRALAQAWRHLESIAEDRRSFERAREEFLAYCTANLTA